MQDEQIREELQRIAAANKGLLRAEDVLKEAEKPTNILHNWGGFVWDKDEAARKYNLNAARQLIRVTVQYLGPVDKQELNRVFVSLSSDRYNREGGGYRPLITVLEDDEYQSQLFDDAVKELKRIQAKYSSLKRLVSVMKAIDEIIQPEPAEAPQDQASV